MNAEKSLSLLTQDIDDRDLMTQCVLGLWRFAQELEATQGADAKEKIVELRDLAQEITDFWDLDGALSEEPDTED